MDEHLPKYFVISQEIINRIQNGELTPGMKIPSENEIISIYGVSNTTARKSLQEIENNGWVVKIKGKGTFVKEKNVVRSVNTILSFTKNMVEAGFTPSTKVLYKELIKTSYSAVINGRRYTLKGPIVKIHRLRFADNIPMLLEVRYISAKLCPGIIEEDLSESLYDIYYKKYNLNLTEIHQMLSTCMIEPDINGFFNIEKPIPGIHVDGVTFCGREIILSMEKSIYRGDKYTFAVRAVQSDFEH